MKEFTEAPNSINIQCVTPAGLPGQITFRGADWNGLLENYLKVEKTLFEKGFKIPPQRTFGQKPQKETEYVEGKLCPKCNNKLIYFEAKGGKHIKCSTSKYDWKTKTSSGCDYVEWADSSKQKTLDEEFPDRISPAQKSLLNKMKSEGTLPDSVDIESLSKEEAKVTIQKYKTW